MEGRLSILLLIHLSLLVGEARSAQVVLNFDELDGGTYLTGAEVQDRYELSDRYLHDYGAVLHSDRPYVVVVNLNEGFPFPQAPSPPNAIGGVTSDNQIDYSTPVVIEFFKPGDRSVPGVTSFISVQLDKSGDGLPVTMTAFDVEGVLLKTVTVNDQGAPVLRISMPGIHSVKLRGQFGSSYDNLTFNPVVAERRFRRGDVDSNGRIELTDPVVILGFLFYGIPEGIGCAKSADADRNGKVDITDALALLAYLFTTGKPLPEPLSACDYDRGSGELTCEASPACP